MNENKEKNNKDKKNIEENNDKKINLDFEEAIEELEKIVGGLEKGGLSLESSLEKFSRGVELVKFCSGELNKAEKKIEMVLKENDEFTDIVPFEDKED